MGPEARRVADAGRALYFAILDPTNARVMWIGCDAHLVLRDPPFPALW